VVFELEGYELFSADFFRFSEGDYVLLNDPINNLSEDVLDVFIVQLPKKVKDSEESLIQIVDEQGNVSGIPYSNNSVFMVHRNNRNYYVDRVEKEFFLGHLIYRKVVKGKRAKKDGEKNKSHISAIRKQLMSALEEGRDEEEARVVPDNVHKTKAIKKGKEEGKGGKKGKGKKN
jgi:hypothetical protein